MGMSYVCPMMSGASARNVEAGDRLDGWGLELSRGSIFACLGPGLLGCPDGKDQDYPLFGFLTAWQHLGSQTYISLLTLRLRGPCFSVPVNKAKATAFTCGHGGPTVSLLPYTIGKSIPKSTHTEGEDWTPPPDGGMTKSHCRRARGMGGIVAAIFGKCNQPQMER